MSGSRQDAIIWRYTSWKQHFAI